MVSHSYIIGSFESFYMPVDIKRMMLAIPTTILGGGVDKLAWAGSPHGSFDMKVLIGLLWA